MLYQLLLKMTAGSSDSIRAKSIFVFRKFPGFDKF